MSLKAACKYLACKLYPAWKHSLSQDVEHVTVRGVQHWHPFTERLAHALRVHHHVIM